MTTYMAYIAVKSQDGQDAVFASPAPTIGHAIREVAAQLNAAVAVSGGYAQKPDEIKALTIVYAVEAGVEKVRHEIHEGNLSVFPLDKDENKGEPMSPVLVMHINPMTVSEQFVR